MTLAEKAEKLIEEMKAAAGISYTDDYSRWWDEDAERINAMSEAAKEFAAKLGVKDVAESRGEDCGRQDGGRFGEGNDCAKEDGSPQSGGVKQVSKTQAPPDIPRPRPRPVTPEDAQKILEKISENPDGFTLDPLSADTPQSGLMCSEFSNDSRRSVKMNAAEISTAETATVFMKWLSSNEDLLVGDSTRFIGGWKDGDDFYIDVATRFEPTDSVTALERGRDAGQYALFNLETFKETWIQYAPDDRRKPADWDAKFQAFLDRQSPEDAEDAKKHGHSSVRSYNSLSPTSHTQEDTHGTGSEVRHSFAGQLPFDVQSVPGVRPESRGVEGPDARSEVVSGRESGTVGGSAGYSGEARSVAEEEVRRLIEPMRELGLDLPKIEVRSGLGRSFAEYDRESDTLYASDKITSRSVARMQKSASDRWVSQANPLLHELGHRVHWQNYPDSYEASEFFDFTPEQRKLVSEKVSRFAATSGREFAAEVIAGVLSGKLYGDDILDLFHDVVNSRAADCGRDDSGRFGPRNDCASDDGGVSAAQSKKLTPRERLESVVGVSVKESVEEAMKLVKTGDRWKIVGAVTRQLQMDGEPSDWGTKAQEVVDSAGYKDLDTSKIAALVEDLASRSPSSAEKAWVRKSAATMVASIAAAAAEFPEIRDHKVVVYTPDDMAGVVPKMMHPFEIMARGGVSAVAQMIPAFHDAAENHIGVNFVGSAGYIDTLLSDETMASRSKKQFSTSQLGHAVVHELGHKLHCEAIRESIGVDKSIAMDRDEIQRYGGEMKARIDAANAFLETEIGGKIGSPKAVSFLSRKLSRYGSSHPLEVVAEYFVGVRIGSVKRDKTIDKFCETMGFPLKHLDKPKKGAKKQ